MTSQFDDVITIKQFVFGAVRKVVQLVKWSTCYSESIQSTSYYYPLKLGQTFNPHAPSRAISLRLKIIYVQPF